MERVELYKVKKIELKSVIVGGNEHDPVDSRANKYQQLV